jgi:3-methyladenine DNA glycosylase AlkD
MDYKLKKPLKKLGQKELEEDIKGFIKNTRQFYTAKIPEMKLLAKKLHEEHELEDFYKIFDELWISGYSNKRILALSALELYEEDFDLETWIVLKQYLKDITDWEEIDSVALEIVGKIILDYPPVKKDVLNISKKRDVYLRRMALMSSIPSIQKKDFTFAFKLLEFYCFNKHERIQEAVGLVIKEISKKNKDIAKKFISKHKKMGEIAFKIATENLKDLRKIKDLKELEKTRIDKKSFWGWI